MQAVGDQFDPGILHQSIVRYVMVDTNWRWANTSTQGGYPVTDKVFIATSLLVNMHNVHLPGLYDLFFQQQIDLLELTNDQKKEVIKFIQLTTNHIYSKNDFDTMLPKYLDSLNLVQ